jgi:hypothetical protein
MSVQGYERDDEEAEGENRRDQIRDLLPSRRDLLAALQEARERVELSGKDVATVALQVLPDGDWQILVENALGHRDPIALARVTAALPWDADAAVLRTVADSLYWKAESEVARNLP